MDRELPDLEVVERVASRPAWPLLVAGLALALSLGLLPAPAGSLPGDDAADDVLVDELVVSRLLGPALLDAAHGSSFCPEGWEDLGSFDLTAYVLARELEFARGPEVEAPCGLKDTYYAEFLFGSGVTMQGSGRARDGSIVHYAGESCFEILDCPRTASGRCATTGRTVAVDRSLIPLGSELLIEGLGRRWAEDTGGWILGHHIDVYYGEDLTYAEAMFMSREDRRVCIRRDSGAI